MNNIDKKMNITHASDLPGPKTVPFFGNFLQLKEARKAGKFHHVLENWAKEYGDVYKISIFSKEYFIVSGSGEYQDILTRRPDDFRRRIIMEEAADEMGLNGVFTSDGKRWKTQRNLTMKTLSNKYLEAFLPVLLNVTERLVNRWQAKADAKELLNVVDETKAYAAELMSNMVFGYDMNTLGTESKEDVIRHHFNRIFPQFYKRINSPFISYWKYFKLPADYQLHRSLKAIKNIFNDVIDEAREKLKNQSTEKVVPKNLLEAMVLTQDEHGNPYTNEEIFANVFSIVLAGEDAVGNTIGWTVNFIADYPEVQKKMQEEVDAVFSDQGSLHDHDYPFWNKNFPYVEAVLKESMRVKPIAPLASFQASHDVDINGIKYDKHATFLALPRLGFVDEDNFYQADKFIPERWLAEKETSGCPHSGAHNEKAFIPFGHGPRYCSGSKLAMFEMKVMFATISRFFEIKKRDESAQVTEKLTLLMEPDNSYIELVRR